MNDKIEIFDAEQIYEDIYENQGRSFSLRMFPTIRLFKL